MSTIDKYSKAAGFPSCYTPLRILSKSLYGDVVLCQCSTTKSLVAIKTCQTDLVCQGGKADDPIAEANTMRFLQSLSTHDNVLCLLDQFEFGNFFCLVYPYLPNGDLFEMIGDLDSTECLIAFAQMANGLNHIHSHGVAHLDVSLENVLVDETGCLKICDFGLATSICRNKKIVNIGKNFYMAPEVAYPGAQPDHYDCRSADMWSLGVSLFMLTFGFQPYNSPSLDDIAFKTLLHHGVRNLLKSYGLQGKMKENERAVKYIEQLLVVEEKRANVSTVLKNLSKEVFTDENDTPMSEAAPESIVRGDICIAA